MSLRAFFPYANTVLVAASSSTAAAPTQLSTAGGNMGWMCSNPSTVPLYVALGSSTISAGVPTTAIPCLGMCIVPYGYLPLTCAPSTAGNWLSAVTSAGSAVPGLFATPGDGI